MFTVTFLRRGRGRAEEGEEKTEEGQDAGGGRSRRKQIPGPRAEVKMFLHLLTLFPWKKKVKR